ncbi:MAG TPA: branched chain amino acid aminotransferase, partial [Bacteroides sp.]|nr:branched chain amino acid aminotransferase [Bacteroides sp.]
MKEIDWANLSFGYMRTDYNVRCTYRDGKWGEIEISSEETINLHMAATSLHYGQEAFEGLKAYRCKDGKIRIFRMEANAERLQSTCRGILMPELPTELFCEMVKKVVKLNERFIPPYESGASLYIRPLLIGTSAQVGVHPASEYLFLIFVTPVGPYFKGGFATNPYVIIREFDRAAPLGTGTFKVGGNYAASLRANKMAHDLGYSCEFYLDAKEKKYIDECGAANFFGIKDNTYVTPLSTSILPSITNRSLMQLAEDMGLKVERRPIPEEELATFEEAGACGTAAVISPIERIDDLENKKSYVIAKDGKPGPISTKLYQRLRAIQYG